MAFTLGSLTQSQQGGGLFGNLGQAANQQAKSSSSISFGSLGQNAQQQQQPTGGLFGGLGQNLQQQPRQSTSGPFSGLGNSGQSKPSLFGGLESSQPQIQQQAHFGTGQTGVPQQQQHQQAATLNLGQSQQRQEWQQGPPSLWEEGRGLGVYRTIPAQVMVIKDKWDPNSLASPLRTYLYQVVDEQNAPFYQPGPGEDEHKWEEAVSKRPGSNCVPTLARGFWDLGKRAQRQREFMEKMHIRLHDINQSLDAQLEIHSQHMASRLIECRRRHVVASQRTLALAANIQILRNRGYMMDNAEEELKSKLGKLEKEVLDPRLYGREQEIWARMLGIRERGKRLQNEIGKVHTEAGRKRSPLSQTTVEAAKKALEAYDVQLRHLHKETALVAEEYEDWGKGWNAVTSNSELR